MSAAYRQHSSAARAHGDWALDPLSRISSAEIEQLWRRACAATDSLFDLVTPAALLERPIPERHRLIFYVGHLEAFDWNLLAERWLGLAAFRPDFDRLFAFGIDPVGGGLPDEPASAWPPIAEIQHYKHRVRQQLDAGLHGRQVSHTDSHTRAQLWFTAIEHRLMHAETLAYLLHQLPYRFKHAPRPVDGHRQGRASDAGVDGHDQVPINDFVEIPPGLAHMGLTPTAAEPFGWDNEFSPHAEECEPFRLQRYKVTNQEFLAFVQAGSYQQRSLWSDADWEWRAHSGRMHPPFWHWREERWWYRGMFHETPLPASDPVYVTHAEASAYARWRGWRLPTEAEWLRAVVATPASASSAHLERHYPWGEAMPDAVTGNFDARAWDPIPVHASPGSDSALGVAQLIGNGWEWTSTVFAPFSGFHAFPFYPGYSANFFDGKHYVLKGGSPRTTAPLLRPSFRNWFQPHYPYLYAGFRCVQA